MNRKGDRTSWDLIWADAICISQTDKSERGHQVQLMHKIYSQAAVVSVWLERADSPNIPYEVAKDKAVKHIIAGPHAETLFRTPYWQRLWIIQEFLLAQKVVIYGSDGQVLHEDTVTPISSGGIHQGADETRRAEEESQKMKALINAFPPEQQRSMFTLMFGMGNFTISLFGAIMAQRYWMGTKLKSMSNCLKAYAESKCRDPRDKVFGLMSLLDRDERDALHRVFPDYSMPEAQVTAIVLAHIMVFDSMILRGGWLIQNAQGKPRRLFLLWYIHDFMEVYRDRTKASQDLRKKFPRLLSTQITNRFSLSVADLTIWLAEH